MTFCWLSYILFHWYSLTISINYLLCLITLLNIKEPLYRFGIISVSSVWHKSLTGILFSFWQRFSFRTSLEFSTNQLYNIDGEHLSKVSKSVMYRFIEPSIKLRFPNYMHISINNFSIDVWMNITNFRIMNYW